ncbi:MAG: hypothetical protein EOO07_18630 [Chitinophagaceae bacterium]|nr:MAG: hypothetical protein EOO07_18630 [Chitinophagaceae bacterium]
MFKQTLSFVKKKLYELLYIEQWQIRYKFNESEGSIFDSTFSSYRKILPPKDRFWADPFVVEKDGKYYVFLEELEYKNGKGYISVTELSEDSTAKVKVEKVLEMPYHLSYPFIFEEQGKYYMIPETIGNNTIELYECISFPFQWKLWGNLMENVIAADTTIVFRDGKYWMFTSIEPQKDVTTDEQLHVFYSDTLRSNNWVPHKANPVVTDVSSARPAGNIFEYQGELYRPSQDCSKRYGWATRINKIGTLNESEYSEENIAHLKPDWENDLLCTHTYNKQGKLSIIDVLVKRSRFF